PALAHVRKVYVLVFFLSEDDYHPWLSPTKGEIIRSLRRPMQGTAAPPISDMNSRRFTRSPRRRGRLSLRVRAPWQAHRKDRTFAQLARHRHIAAHHAREFAREGKSEPRAAEVLSGCGIGLGELLEQLCLLLRRHANAGIGDGELDEIAASCWRRTATCSRLPFGVGGSCLGSHRTAA